jgi:hypothetical protein
VPFPILQILSRLFLRRSGSFFLCFFLCFFPLRLFRLCFFFWRFFLLLWFVVVFEFFVFEFIVFPSAVIEGSDGGIAWVEDDVVMVGSELGAVEVGAGGLEGIEEQAGGFVFDLAGEEQAHDFHESDLDGVSIFEDRQDEGGGSFLQAAVWVGAGAGVIGGKADALVMIALVKETEAIAAEGGRSALDAVDFDVLAAIGISGH